MTRRKTPKVRRESALTGADEEAKTKAIENWLRTVDRPLAKDRSDRTDAKLNDECQN